MHRWFLPSVMILLAIISLLTLKSVAPDLAPLQTIFFLLSAVIFVATTRISFASLTKSAWWAYWGLCALLIISLAVGLITGKTGRWIPVGFFNVQPSQLAVPVVTLAVVDFLKKNKIDSWLNLGKSLAIIALPAALILIEPDLGTTLVYLASLAVILFLSNISTPKIITLLLSTLVLVFLGWTVGLRSYQKQRITSFVAGHQDTQGAGYNARQALIAVGSGKLVGRGLGQGSQSHLRFLPERQTDFIFASLAEEFGFIGSTAVLLLYGLIVAYCIKTALNTKSKEQYYFCLATTTMIVLHVVVNIGMNIGLLPITGLTLPLLSYGGSSILTVSLMFGLVQNISLNLPNKAKLHLT